MVTDMEEVIMARDSHPPASGSVSVRFVLPDVDGNVTRLIALPNGDGCGRSYYGL